MGTAATQRAMDEQPRLVAPVWHTIIYFALFGSLWYGLAAAKPAIHKPLPRSLPFDRSWIYLLIFVANGIALGLMYLGLRISKTRLSDLMGAGWADRNQARRDVIVGALFSLVLLAVNVLMLASFPPPKHPGERELIELMSPSGLLQFVLFVSVMASAGFFEELIFRGYLLRQLNHFVGINSAIVIQAVIFAALHGFDQSVGGAAAKFVGGAFLGLLTVQRKSLLPGMIAHGCFNGIGAVALGLSHVSG